MEFQDHPADPANYLPRREQTYLLIPPVGLLQVFATERTLETEEYLHARDNIGDFLSLTVTRDGEPVGEVEWLVNQIGPMNERAREALAMLTGTHMIFTGDVIFANMDPEKVYEIVAVLSRKE